MGQLHLHVLGTFEFDHAGQRITGLTRRKALALFAYLCLETPGLLHHRDKLAALLWPDVPQSDARASLRQCLLTIRQALADHTETEEAHLRITAQTVGINPAALDCDMTHFFGFTPTEDAAALDAALALHNGEVLAGFSLADAPEFDEWLFFQRESVQQQLRTILELRRTLAEKQQDWPRTIDTLRLLLILDPLAEELHRALMEAYFANGERRAALDQYATCCTILKTELNLDPLPETTALYNRLKTAQVAARLVTPQPVPLPTPPAEVQSETPTFLFTDIEGSTKLWEQAPAEMAVALARHDDVLRHACAANNGTVFQTVGDAFHVAFNKPADALAAALQTQRALNAMFWPTPRPIRVRMALHTGSAEKHDSDYTGPTLNRIAGLMSAGHGGQVLLSQATTTLLHDALPADVTLRDMGERMLPDLSQPERIFQVVATDLPSEFPALRTLDNRPTNLPAQMTAFIGRDNEVQTVRSILQRPGVRLLTLTGPGGTGKTRLSLEAAASVRDIFRDGVYFVALAALTDPALVIQAIAQTVAVTEGGGQPLEMRLAEQLRDKHMLLVLDNFEQVLDAASPLERLLSATTRLTILVTSRSVLKVYGEHEYSVPPLALPDVRRLPPLEKLSQYAGVALFMARAQAVRPDFRLSDDNAGAIVELCARLDGLPLAIELVAARSKVFTPQAMISRLSRRLALVTGGARTLPERQQTLRGAIRWSFDLLDNAERQLFGRISVFTGGCTIEAAEAICGDPGDEGALLDGLMALADKSLLRNVTGADGEPRFMMLETIREFAQESLEASGEADNIRQAHAQYYVNMVETIEPQLRGPEQALWLGRLENDHDNVRAVLNLSVTQAKYDVVVQIAAAIWRFWFMHGYITEGRRWVDTALTHADVLPTLLQAKALRISGKFAQTQGDWAEAKKLLTQSLTIYTDLHDNEGRIYALSNLGVVAQQEGDYPGARVLIEECLALQRKQGNKHGEAVTLNNLSMTVCAQGDFGQAEQYGKDSLALFRQLKDRSNIAIALLNMGLIHLQQERLDLAEADYRESLVGWQSMNGIVGIAHCLEGLAAIASKQSQPARCARLFGAAIAIRDAVNAPLAMDDRQLYSRYTDTSRSELAEGDWERFYAEGKALSVEAAIPYALSNVLTESTIPV